MNNLFKSLLIVVGVALGLGAVAIRDLNVSKLIWGNSKQVEYKVPFSISATQLAGDSLIFKFPTTTIVKGLSIRTRGNGTAYTSATTDTIKFYGSYNGAAVMLGYITDTTFTTTAPLVSYAPLSTGVVGGYEYSLSIPTSKFTGGNQVYECNLDVIELW